MNVWTSLTGMYAMSLPQWSAFNSEHAAADGEEHVWTEMMIGRLKRAAP